MHTQRRTAGLLAALTLVLLPSVATATTPISSLPDDGVVVFDGGAATVATNGAQTIVAGAFLARGR